MFAFIVFLSRNFTLLRPATLAIPILPRPSWQMKLFRVGIGQLDLIFDEMADIGQFQVVPEMLQAFLSGRGLRESVSGHVPCFRPKTRPRIEMGCNPQRELHRAVKG